MLSPTVLAYKDLDQRRPLLRVAGNGVADHSWRRLRRCGHQVRRQRRRDDVAGGEVPVHGHRAWPPGRVKPDVGAHHGVDGILGAAQLALALGRLYGAAQLHPLGVVGDPQGHCGLREPFDLVHQSQQLGAQLGEVAALLVLVLQRAAKPEQDHRRRMRVDLDGPPGSPRVRVHVQPEGGGDPGPAWRAGEFGLSGVGRVRAGLEFGEVAVQVGLAAPLAGRVGHHQRRVDRD